jgi:hypothetical protein
MLNRPYLEHRCSGKSTPCPGGLFKFKGPPGKPDPKGSLIPSRPAAPLCNVVALKSEAYIMLDG